MSCTHRVFDSEVIVTRITRSDDDPTVIAYCADVKVRCVECSEPFLFVGPPVGALPDEPTISADATTLRAPLVPASDPRVQGGLAGFRVNFKQQRLAREKADA